MELLSHICHVVLLTQTVYSTYNAVPVSKSVDAGKWPNLGLTQDCFSLDINL